MRRFVYIIYALFSLLLFSCHVDEPQNNPAIIGHKGCGPIDENGNINLYANSWEALKEAITLLDGTEMDIQMSADSTLWIFHNHEIMDCNDSLINFSTCTDAQITLFNKCSYNNKIIRFEEFIKKSTIEDWRGKTLCLDLKVLNNYGTQSLFERQEDKVLYVRDLIYNYTKNNQFLVYCEVFNEEQYLIFNEVFKDKTILALYKVDSKELLSWKNKNFKLSVLIHHLDLDNENNLKIDDIWGVYKPDEFYRSLKFSPDFIQGDNVPMLSFIKSIQRGIKPLTIDERKFHFSGEDEFYSIENSKVRQLDKPFMYQFEIDPVQFEKGTFLTFTAYDIKDSTVIWEAIKLDEVSNPSIFFYPKFLHYINVSNYSISIWNQNKNLINHRIKLKKIVLPDD